MHYTVMRHEVYCFLVHLKYLLFRAFMSSIEAEVELRPTILVLVIICVEITPSARVVDFLQVDVERLSVQYLQLITVTAFEIAQGFVIVSSKIRRSLNFNLKLIFLKKFRDTH